MPAAVAGEDELDAPEHRNSETAWGKLRRRKLIQWGLAYLAGAWVLLQALGFAADAFHWPDATKQYAILLLAIGLPVALALAWFHGERGQQYVSGMELLVLAGLLLCGGGALWFYGQHRAAASAERPVAAVSTVAAAESPSIAVLPFANMSPEKDQEYFSDGLSEQMLDQLAKVQQLRVIARTSSFSFKGKEVDATTIARTLGVTHLLEGSVRKAGDQLRISAKLIRGADGAQVWGETYDRKLEDVFRVQDEIAAAVVAQLKVRMLGSALPATAPTDSAVYADYLRAGQLYAERTERSLREATRLLEGAVTVDPDYGPAWQLLGRTYVEQAWASFLPLHEGFGKARAALQRAIEIDPGDASALGAMSQMAKDYDMNMAESARQLQRALALSPDNQIVLGSAGYFASSLGEGQRATEIFEHRTRLDPVNGTVWGDLGYVYLMFGRYDDAVAAVRKSLELQPEAIFQHMHLAEAYLLLGRMDAAREEFAREPHEIMRIFGQAYVDAATGQAGRARESLGKVSREHPEFSLMIAVGYARLGDVDAALGWLERGLTERDGAVLDARIYPFLEPLRADPRWEPLLHKMGLADTQIAPLRQVIAAVPAR